jgi:proton glutamate symport protein
MAENPKRRLALHWKILIGLVLGIAVGLVLNFTGGSIREAAADRRLATSAIDFIVGLNKLVGDLFIRSLRLIAVPVVLFSLTVGVAGLGDLKKVGRIGGRTIAVFLFSAVCAISIGLVLVNIVRPGTMVSDATRESLQAQYQAEVEGRIAQREAMPGVWQQVLDLVPANPFDALARGDMLQTIVISVLLGIGLTLLPPARAAPIIDLFSTLTEVVVRIVQLIMLAAPVAVFCLMAPLIARMGAGVLAALLAYALVIVGGLLIVVLVQYPLMVRLLGRYPLGRFFRGIAPAQLTAFSTSSSNATLPVTMDCVQHRLGVSQSVTSFVCSFGTTINMDGTALYQAVATVFIAQLYGIPLSIADQLTIVLAATLASIGTPGIPGAGVVMLVIVLESVGVPPAGIAVILGVDRLLDMCRTVVNVTGDAMTSVIIARAEGERFEQPAGA